MSVSVVVSADLPLNSESLDRMNERMNENARILSAFENRLRAGFV